MFLTMIYICPNTEEYREKRNRRDREYETKIERMRVFINQLLEMSFNPTRNLYK